MSERNVGPNIEGHSFLEHLGTGGYSDVYLYERRKPKMRVAVKVLTSALLSESELGQFAAEAETMAELADHPYIVQVFSTGTTEDDRPYLIMKYYPPPNLGERAASERLSVAEVLRIGIQICSAVETAHRAGILHRDIKPANILISQYGEPGLADFGIAGKTLETDADDDLGVSIPWSPPEVLTGQSNGSVASDVYSLCATFWHLLAGRSPFEAPGGDNSPRALMGRILRTAPSATGRADAPDTLNRLLQQGMSKHPQQRPGSAIELARALQGVEQEMRLARTEIVGSFVGPGSGNSGPRPTVPTVGSFAPPAQESAPRKPPSSSTSPMTSVRPAVPTSPPPAVPAPRPVSPVSGPLPTSVRPAVPTSPPPAVPAPSSFAAPPATPAAPPLASPPTTARPAVPSPGASPPTTARPSVPSAGPVASPPTTARSATPSGEALATSRRPTGPVKDAPDAAAEPAEGLNKRLVAVLAGAAVIVAIVVGVVVVLAGGKHKSSATPPKQPVGTDQGGFGTGDLAAPTVTVTYDPTKKVLSFTWSADAQGGSAPEFVYTVGGTTAAVGPTKVTHLDVPTTDPTSVCLTVSSVADDGTRAPSVPVCGSP